MAIGLYWWRPTREIRSLAGELVRHAQAWARLVAAQKGGFCNFGDEYSFLLLKHYLREAVEWAPLRRADVVAVGSVLNAYERAASRALVFGSGVRNPAAITARMLPEGRAVLVRGSLTRDVLGLPSTVPLGDPGLVVRDLAGIGHRPTGSGPIALPHFAATQAKEGRAALKCAQAQGYRVVPPNLHPLRVAQAIASSDLVLTSSLHGLVFSHSLGTPCKLVSLGGHPEPSFKYDDYLSVFELRSEAPPLAELIATHTVSAIIDSIAEETQVVSDRLPTVVGDIDSAARTLVLRLRQLADNRAATA